MTGGMPPPEWSDLLDALAEDRLTDEQAQSLARLLRADGEFRRCYMRYIGLLTSLTWQSQAIVLADSSAHFAAEQNHASNGPSSEARTPTNVRSFKRWHGIVSVMALCLVAGFAVLWWNSGSSDESGFATIQRVDDRVLVTRHTGEQLVLDAEQVRRTPFEIVSGDFVTTEAAGSATILAGDGTELRVSPESRLSLSQVHGLQLKLSQGRVEARVVPQKPGEALELRTDQAHVRVIGTELEVLALKQRTDIAVTAGLVRVTRVVDGELVDVGASQYASIANAGRLVVRDMPRPPEQWSEDFEKAPPTGWTGRFVQTDLPVGSRGGLLAAPVQGPDGMSLELRSPTVDTGLFAWHADSVLHMTFRIQPPDWFHIALVARSIGGAPETLMTYLCIKPELWQTKPGRWQTVSIPLSQFQYIGSGQEEPSLGRIPVRLALRCKNGMTGVALDRVWVDRRD